MQFFFSTSAEVDLFDEDLILTLPLVKTDVGLKCASFLLFTANVDFFKGVVEDICINGDSCGRKVVVLIDDTSRCCGVHSILNLPSLSPLKTFYN